MSKKILLVGGAGYVGAVLTHELLERGVIAKMPKITIIQAEGANPLYRMWVRYRDSQAAEAQNRDRKGAGKLKLEPVSATTLATAIKIGAPLSWSKAMRGLRWSAGEVEQVSEQEIADAKAMVGLDGIGCEPASAVTLAGLKKMVATGGVKPDEGYEVEVDEAQLVKLLSARFRRDIHRPNHEDASPSDANPADPDVDPQLARAVEYVKLAASRR